MLKVALEKEGYVLTDVTNLDEVQAVLDGTLQSSSGAIYLQDRNTDDPVEVKDLDSDQVSNIISMLDKEGLLKILDDDADAIQNANDRLEDESIIAQMEEGESRNLYDDDDSVIEVENDVNVISPDFGTSSTFRMGMEDFMDGAEVVLSKDDKIEILQAAASDLLDTIYEMRSEAKEFIEILGELLDSSEHKSQNAMSRAVQAIGADLIEDADGETEVKFNFQQLQMDRVTEATMWAAAAIIDQE